jgi:hypothetical protein
MLILNSQSSQQFIAGVKRLKIIKYVLIGFYLVSLAIAYTRLTIKSEYKKMYLDFTDQFMVPFVIDIICNIVAQSFILISFYFSFKFFRDTYIKKNNHEKMSCKLKFLTCWVIFLIV